ncbi:MAG TPA: LPS export ABC transporter periplasmic protein LptC [Rhodocyclaceae bacterium]|nr:LPS export ABC transporter periplasmic protein LptC [Rhodocyclaceae bacterium]
MPLPLDRVYPIVALAALAAATLWLEQATRSDEPPAAAQSRKFPDFIGEQIRMIRFDAQGERKYELVADKITHYPRGDIAELDAPRLRYMTADGELRIDADWAESRDGGNVLWLVGNVEVFREGLAGNPDLTLSSNTLTLWPDDQRAATDEPVVLTRGDSIARGNAMRADNLFGTLELIGQASVLMPRSPRKSP